MRSKKIDIPPYMVITLLPVKITSGGIEMAIMEISVVPIGTDNPSISHYVAECVAIVKEKGLPYELTSMGTNVEGELGDLLWVAEKMHELPFKRGAQRVLTSIKVDDRRDKGLSIRGKKEAVERRL
jgi:uncharacterized protein (TIGR00106 family)